MYIYIHITSIIDEKETILISFNKYTYNIYIYIIIILTSGYIIYETHYFQDIKKNMII